MIQHTGQEWLLNTAANEETKFERFLKKLNGQFVKKRAKRTCFVWIPCLTIKRPETIIRRNCLFNGKGED